MSFSHYTTIDPQTLTQELSVDPTRGLPEEEVLARREKYGPNILKEDHVTAWGIFVRQFKSSFIYLLVAAAGLAFALGELFDGSMIVLFLLINASLGFYQEYRSEQTVLLLKRYVKTKAKVRRDGSAQAVSAEDLVPGDVVILEAGDAVPADLRLIKSLGLDINEEVLTGESVPITKTSASFGQALTELYQAKNICFSGTIVVSGRGEGIVIATGSRSEIGAIARLAGAANHASQFEQELNVFSKFILYLVIATLTFIFIANILLKGWSSNIAELAIFSIALAVSVVPEALPVVMTFSLSRGARRLAKNQVVVKRLSAIEDLGSIQILCTDKTGTLTENKLTVYETFGTDRATVLRASNMGGSYLEATARGQAPDPFDSALWESLDDSMRTRLTACKKISEIPFDPIRHKNSALFEYDNDTILIVRGAPETILASSRISSEEHARVLSWIKNEGYAGRRVLAVAEKALRAVDYDSVQDETDLAFIGCVSFIDPVKETARQTIKDAAALNVKIKILTGDSPEVAGTVAAEVGLAADPREVMTAREFFMHSDDEQKDLLHRTNVFARVSPEEKYRIIELLQKEYQVGFLGEGINDAPALKVANVAIAVQSASDIAREAADIILLEKSLEAVVDGIREGRAIFANTIKYIKSSLSSNFGNFYAIAISSLFIPFLPMLPLQILLVNLLSDFPAIAIATDTVDPKELREPKQYNVRKIIMFGTVLGITSTLFDFITFAHFYLQGGPMLQTHWFMISIITEILFLFSIRSHTLFLKAKAPSAALLVLSLLAIVTTLAIPFTSFGQDVFGFIRPTKESLGVVIAIITSYFITTEIVKLIYYRVTAARPARI